ncbi:Multidrug transporter AcrB [uncultured Paludibacter sp.]|uniref:Multidrug transporter AcrB n=1 Tax=uncultured Paludibacter sp. TaxID=497635 RepID=A0A653AF98_9BACT|nr:Multidrug transporter AcrB [uncultured Paludibacter sp.]
MKIYESAVKKPVMTILVFIGVIILGLFSLNKIPVDLFPKIETNSIMVITSYDGASASDIETNVTKPLENTLNTVSNLKRITSSSRENRSIITLEFNYGEDLDVLTNDVRDKLNMVKSYLPKDATEPIIFKFSTDMIPVVMISATADKSLPALYRILEDNVANPLARIKGVGAASVSGAPERVIQVYIDPVKLEAYHLTIEGIGQAIRMENLNTPGGSIDIGNQTYSMRVEGEFKDPLELNKIVVGTSGGKTIYLSDVATVEDAHQERLQESYINGRQGALVVVQKQSGANTVSIANNIMNILPEIKKNLPSDVKLNILFDTSDNIKHTINGLAETVMFAFLFVVLVVLFFLGRWRATIIIILTIPVSLISSFIYLYATGGSLNIISLSSLSIAIGMVVDDAIVVLENITTHIERGSSPKSAAIHGTNEVSLSVVASTLTIIAVFFPLTMISGMTGVMFAQLGWIVTIIITVSLICAITLTPMLTSQLLRYDRQHTTLFKKVYAPIERFLDRFDNKYASMVNWTVRHRKTTMGIATVFVIIAFVSAMGLGTEFIPAQDNGRLGVTMELPVGTRMEITRDLALKLRKEWADKYKAIDLISFSVGTASSSNIWGSLQNNGGHIISMNVKMKPLKDRDMTVFALADSLRNSIKQTPEIEKSNVLVGGGMSMMGGQSTLDVEVYGYDFEKTDKIAKQLKDGLSEIKGLANVTVSRGDYVPEYQVVFDRDKLALNGLNVATASSFLQNRINGMVASLYREEGEEYNIRISYDPRYRKSIEDIENILIYNNMGQAIRIQDVGKVIEKFTPPTIERKNRQRLVTVSTTLSGISMDKAVTAINGVLKKIDIPSDVYTELGGTYLDQQESFSDMGVLLLLIILLVYIVMASQFESLIYPFIIMVAVPFAFAGVVLTLVLTGTTFNMMSFIGIILLVGIVVKNGIVLVDYINLNRERGMGVIQAVVKGGHSRLRPVIMTTATTILGMVPLAISTSEGSEMWKPMAVSVIGGLTVSTILTLLIVPALYVFVASSGIKRKKHKLEKQKLLQQA